MCADVGFEQKQSITHEQQLTSIFMHPLPINPISLTLFINADKHFINGTTL